MHVLNGTCARPLGELMCMHMLNAHAPALAHAHAHAHTLPASFACSADMAARAACSALSLALL